MWRVAETLLTVHGFGGVYAPYSLSLFLYLDITEQNVCTFFCQLEPWRNEGIACGLDIPAVVTPNFTESPGELQQLALNAGEEVDQVWVDAAAEFSVAAEAPVYGSEFIFRTVV